VVQPDWKATADDTLAAAERRVVNRSHGAVAVESLLWYGAVDIATEHAVVWVLLAASDAEAIPAWFSPTAGESSADPQQAALEPGLLTWMRELREEVRGEFDRRGWPSAATLRVMFDSAARVNEHGWQYFK